METHAPIPDLIRLARTPADADAVLRMMETFCGLFNYPFDQPLRQMLIRQVLENPSLGSLWLVELENKPVGYAALTYGFAYEFGGKTALVDELFIEEDYRGAGLGRRILQSLQKAADELGVSVIHLQTEKYNPRAKQLYESAGFVDQERSTLTWKKPD
ncbi:GNAT family N-acetyltransferase [Larkinella humicola]|uniref:GNAT family N-acetyltransferase n=1 Tax=Larkinella humicola TaxID=2607654 RepID=A0A5N1JDI4_9BACT|nr:GNAT family N-acetyltransferase [Larkinella humicola]KAA9347793.1 GNAT family N-acetyltransferase [Larkinella humicola]